MPVSDKPTAFCFSFLTNIVLIFIISLPGLALGVDIHPDVCSDEARMYPHPQDCTKFTRCVNKRLVTFQCPPRTAFDPETQICAWRVGKNGCGGKLAFPSTQWKTNQEDVVYETSEEIVPYMATVAADTRQAHGESLENRKDANSLLQQLVVGGGVNSDDNFVDTNQSIIDELDTDQSAFESFVGTELSVFNVKKNLSASGNSKFTLISPVNNTTNLTNANLSNFTIDDKFYDPQIYSLALQSSSNTSLPGTTNFTQQVAVLDNTTDAVLLENIVTPKQDSALNDTTRQFLLENAHNESLWRTLENIDSFYDRFQESLSESSNFMEQTAANSSDLNNTNTFVEFNNNGLDSHSDFLLSKITTNSSKEQNATQDDIDYEITTQEVNVLDSISTTTSWISTRPNVTSDTPVSNLWPKPNMQNTDEILNYESEGGDRNASFNQNTGLMNNHNDTFNKSDLDSGNIELVHNTSFNSTQHSVTELPRGDESNQNKTENKVGAQNDFKFTSTKNGTIEIIQNQRTEKIPSHDSFYTFQPDKFDIITKDTRWPETISTGLTPSLHEKLETTTSEPHVSYSDYMYDFFSFLRAVPYFRALGNRSVTTHNKNSNDSSQQISLNQSSSLNDDNKDTEIGSNYNISESINAVAVSAPGANFSFNEEFSEYMNQTKNITILAGETETSKQNPNHVFDASLGVNSTHPSVKETTVSKQSVAEGYENLSNFQEEHINSTNATKSLKLLQQPAELFIRLPLTSRLNDSQSETQNESKTVVYVKDLPKNDVRPSNPGGYISPSGDVQDLPSSDYKTRMRGSGRDRKLNKIPRHVLSSRPLYVKLYNLNNNDPISTHSEETESAILIPRHRLYDLLRQRRRSQPTRPRGQKSILPRDLLVRINQSLRNNDRRSEERNGRKQNSRWRHAQLERLLNPDEESSPKAKSLYNLRDTERNRGGEPRASSQDGGSEEEVESPDPSKAVPLIVSFKSAPYMVQGLKKPFQCPATDGHFADPDDCAVFYHCDNGVAYRRDCPPGQTFHRAVVACVSAKLAPPCFSRGEQKQQLHQLQHPPHNIRSSDDISNHSANSQCPEGDGLYRDPDSCRHYLDCVQGHPVRRQCLRGTVFDPLQARCTWSKFVPGCERPGAGDATGKPKDSVNNDVAGIDAHQKPRQNQTQEETIPTETTRASDKLTLPMFPCLRDGFYRHESRCDVYYICAQGKSLQLTCEPGTSFDPALNMCVWSQLVPGCDVTQSTSESEAGTRQGDDETSMRVKDMGAVEAVPLLQSTINSGSSCPENTGVFPLPGDCTVYITCVEGHSAILRCLPGMAFDPNTERCLPRSLVLACSHDRKSSSKNPRESFVCPSAHGVYPDKLNCSAFIHCFQGVPYRHLCQAGTAYSPEARSCTWKYLVPQCWKQGALNHDRTDVSRPSQDMKTSDSPTSVQENPESDNFQITKTPDITSNEEENPTKEDEHDKNNNLTKPTKPDGFAEDKRLTQFLDRQLKHLGNKSKLLRLFSKLFQDGEIFERADQISYEGQRGNPNSVPWTEEDSSASAHAQSRQEQPWVRSKYTDFDDIIHQGVSHRNPWDNWRWSPPMSGTLKTYSGSPIQEQFPVQAKPEDRAGLAHFRCPPVKDGFYRDDVLCDVFHRCVMGEKFTFVCPPGTFFRIEGNFCDHSAIMPDCNQDGVRISALSRFPHPGTLTSQSDPAPFPAPQTWSFRSEGQNDRRVTPLVRINSPQEVYDLQHRVEAPEPQTSPPPSCPAPSGLFPHPGNCHQFLFCAHSLPLVLTCPATLLYNSRTLTCDFPAKVVCGAQYSLSY